MEINLNDFINWDEEERTEMHISSEGNYWVCIYCGHTVGEYHYLPCPNPKCRTNNRPPKKKSVDGLTIIGEAHHTWIDDSSVLDAICAKFEVDFGCELKAERHDEHWVFWTSGELKQDACADCGYLFGLLLEQKGIVI